ncbi:hypothetical protein [Burkholderia sp. LA-2-3-30-S1-D2]|uniref:hypothetical protein n=1 Tax=Burkholderia sp. LA-2-3-30-S1-D2 TaxID=1637862 RepID=UPI000A8C8EEC|nr:hypothetical protein [Burkholderia sp. LA-2-3-30-S1-D2]
MTEGPQLRPLWLACLAAIGGDLRGGNGELAEFDVNDELLSGVEAGIVYQPSAGG